MSKGRFYHSVQHSRGGKKPLAPSLDDEANEGIFIDGDSVAPGQVLEDIVESNEKPSITDALEAAAVAETPITKRRKHALQRIEER